MTFTLSSGEAAYRRAYLYEAGLLKKSVK